MMELDEAGLAGDPNIEQNLRRLQDEEKLLIEQQAAIDAGTVDDIAALEHQDALRLNQLRQRELHKQQQMFAQRLLRQQQQEAAQAGAGGCAGAGAACAGAVAACASSSAPRREQPRRRTAACTVRVNNLHAAEAIETDV